jgi:predicted PurR-regulated permease PerM
MKNFTLDKKQKQALTITTFVAIAIGIYFLLPFFSVIVVSLIAAYMFFPIFTYARKKVKKDGTAASITLLAAFLTVVIPLIFILFVTFFQLRSLLSNVSVSFNSGTATDLTTNIINQINAVIAQFTGNQSAINIDMIKDQLIQFVSYVGERLLSILSSSIGGIAGLVTTLILFMYIFTSFLINNKKIVTYIQKVNPLGKDITNLYLSQAAAMTKAMVRGQFLIAAAQGITGALILYIAGIHYFAFMALILTVLSIIPLGGGIVAIPIGIIMILFGQYWQGTLVLLSHFFLITNIDNVLRPRLVPQKARLNNALSMLSVFAGIAMFGFLGIIIGPVVMILIVTTINVYLSEESANKAVEVS